MLTCVKFDCRSLTNNIDQAGENILGVQKMQKVIKKVFSFSFSFIALQPSSEIISVNASVLTTAVI